MKMAPIAQSVCWVCLVLIAYTYFFYPVILFFAYALVQVRRDWDYLVGRRNRRASSLTPDELPTVTLIVPVHNEQACLSKKIFNLGQIDYPSKKLETVFVSDGSTDRTNEILSSAQNRGIHVVLVPNRKGKAHALNVAVAQAHNDILIFSDVYTLPAP